MKTGNKIYFYIIFWHLIAFFSCNELKYKHVKSKDINSNCDLDYYIDKNNFKQGVYSESCNGILNYIINYKDDVKNGEMVGYFYSGKIKFKGFYKYGLKDSLWKEFYPNGKIKTEVSYVKDKFEGYKKEYDESGQLIEVACYFEDKLIGGRINYINYVLSQYRFYYSGNEIGKLDIKDNLMPDGIFFKFIFDKNEVKMNEKIEYVLYSAKIPESITKVDVKLDGLDASNYIMQNEEEELLSFMVTKGYVSFKTKGKFDLNSKIIIKSLNDTYSIIDSTKIPIEVFE